MPPRRDRQQGRPPEIAAYTQRGELDGRKMFRMVVIDCTDRSSGGDGLFVWGERSEWEAEFPNRTEAYFTFVDDSRIKITPYAGTTQLPTAGRFGRDGELFKFDVEASYYRYNRAETEKVIARRGKPLPSRGSEPQGEGDYSGAMHRARETIKDWVDPRSPGPDPRK